MKDCEKVEKIEGGSIYRCKTCNEKFFVSYKENSCQCSGCADNNLHECQNKDKEIK
jgi:hypothetical protein